MSLQEKAKAVLEKIKGYQVDADGWKTAKNSKDVTVWYKSSPDWDGTLYKAEAVIDSDPETVFSYVDPNPEGPRARWDKAVKTLELVEQVDKDVSVVRTITHSAVGGLISSRDFTDLVINITDENAISTNAQGIEHEKCPASSEHVRGTNHPCAIICHRIPGEADKTRVASYIQTDLGGMLPKTLVDNALPSNMVDFFSSLKTVLQEDGKWKGAMNGNTE